MIKMCLNELIKERGLTKTHIAKQLGVDKNTLSNWVAGRSFPRLDQSVELAELLNCNVDDLYTIEEDNKKTPY